jgi:hypothetical protein
LDEGRLDIPNLLVPLPFLVIPAVAQVGTKPRRRGFCGEMVTALQTLSCDADFRTHLCSIPFTDVQNRPIWAKLFKMFFASWSQGTNGVQNHAKNTPLGRK